MKKLSLAQVEVQWENFKNLHISENLVYNVEVTQEGFSVKISKGKAIWTKDQQEYLDKKFSEVNTRIDKLEDRMDKLEDRMDKVEQRMNKLEQRMDKLEQRMDKLEQRMDVIEQKIDAMNTTMPEWFKQWSIQNDKKLDYIVNRIDNLVSKNGLIE